MNDYVSVSQAAELLKVTRQTVLYHIKQGRLPAERLAGVYLISRAAVESFTPPKGGWPQGRARR